VALTCSKPGIGNIIGPLTFRDEDKPGYIPAKIVMVVTTASAATLTGVLMAYYKWENARRDRLYASEEHEENSEFFDLTDRENHEFRVSHLPIVFVFFDDVNILLTVRVLTNIHVFCVQDLVMSCGYP
jgi:hypothetical protein